MAYEPAEFVDNLKRARISKGMTQKDLEALSGIPQAHLSKIESGSVDLKLTSLVELARLLDLELMLVPRKFVPAVEAIVQGGYEPEGHSRSLREIRKLRSAISAAELPDSDVTLRLRRTLREFENLRLSASDETELHKTLRQMQDLLKVRAPKTELANFTHSLQALRNRIVHKTDDLFSTPRPAYTLDDEDEDA